MKKRLLPLVLCTSLLASIPAFAEAPTPDTDSVSQIATGEAQAPTRQLSFVKIKEFHRTDAKIIGFSAANAEGMDASYTLTSDTLVLDATTGKSTSSAVLSKEMEAYLFHAPQSTVVEALVINVPQDAGCPMLHTVESVHDMGETLQITTDNGGLHLFVKDTVSISSFFDETEKTTDAIRVGSRVFAWYDVVMESYPAQAHPQRICVIPTENKASTLVVLNNKQTDIETKVVEGTVYLPLREAATLLDCQVEWDKDTRSAMLFNEKRKMRITLENDLYASFAADPRLSGMTAPKTLGAPFLENGTLYAPAEVFSVLVGFEVALTDSALTITKK